MLATDADKYGPETSNSVHLDKSIFVRELKKALFRKEGCTNLSKTLGLKLNDSHGFLGFFAEFINPKVVKLSTGREILKTHCCLVCLLHTNEPSTFAIKGSDSKTAISHVRTHHPFLRHLLTDGWILFSAEAKRKSKSCESCVKEIITGLLKDRSENKTIEKNAAKEKSTKKKQIFSKQDFVNKIKEIVFMNEKCALVGKSFGGWRLSASGGFNSMFAELVTPEIHTLSTGRVLKKTHGCILCAAISGSKKTFSMQTDNRKTGMAHLKSHHNDMYQIIGPRWDQLIASAEKKQLDIKACAEEALGSILKESADKNNKNILGTTGGLLINQGWIPNTSEARAINSSVVDWLLRQQRSFRIPGDDGFRKLVKDLRCDFIPGNEKHLKKLELKMLNANEKKIKQSLTKARNESKGLFPFVSLQCDEWESESGLNVFGVIACWYDSSLCRILYPCIALSVSLEPWTVSSRFQVIEKGLAKWQIKPSDIHGIVSNVQAADLLDEASDDIEVYNDVSQATCLSDTFSRVLKGAFETGEGFGHRFIKKVHSLVSFWRVSENRKRLYAEQCKVYDSLVKSGHLNKASVGIAKYSDSNGCELTAVGFLELTEENLYRTLQRIVRLYPVLKSLCLQSDIQLGSAGFIDDKLLRSIILVASALQPFADALSYLQGYKYATYSLKYTLISAVMHQLQNESDRCWEFTGYLYPGTKRIISVLEESVLSTRMFFLPETGDDCLDINEEEIERMKENSKGLRLRLAEYLDELAFDHTLINAGYVSPLTEKELICLCLDPRTKEYEALEGAFCGIRVQAYNTLKKTIEIFQSDLLSSGVTTSNKRKQEKSKPDLKGKKKRKRDLSTINKTQDEKRARIQKLCSFVPIASNSETKLSLKCSKMFKSPDTILEEWRLVHKEFTSDELYANIWEFWNREKEDFPLLYMLATRFLSLPAVSSLCQKVLSFGEDLSDGEYSASRYNFHMYENTGFIEKENDVVDDTIDALYKIK